MSVCETCGRARNKVSRFCSSGCADSWRQQHPYRIKVDPALPAPVLEVPLPVPVMEVVPLSGEELARLAIFVLTGQVSAVMDAIEWARQPPYVPPDD